MEKDVCTLKDHLVYTFRGLKIGLPPKMVKTKVPAPLAKDQRYTKSSKKPHSVGILKDPPI